MRVSHKRKLATRKRAKRFIAEAGESVLTVRYSRGTGTYYIKMTDGQTVRISDHLKNGSAGFTKGDKVWTSTA